MFRLEAFYHFIVTCFVHCLYFLDCLLFLYPNEMLLERTRSISCIEIEKSFPKSAQKLGNVFVICAMLQISNKSNDSLMTPFVSRYELLCFLILDHDHRAIN